MRFLYILLLLAGSLSSSGCASIHIASGPQRPFYELRHQAPPGRGGTSHAHAPREFSIQFSRSLP